MKRSPGPETVRTTRSESTRGSQSIRVGAISTETFAAERVEGATLVARRTKLIIPSLRIAAPFFLCSTTPPHSNGRLSQVRERGSLPALPYRVVQHGRRGRSDVERA